MGQRPIHKGQMINIKTQDQVSGITWTATTRPSSGLIRSWSELLTTSRTLTAAQRPTTDRSEQRRRKGPPTPAGHVVSSLIWLHSDSPQRDVGDGCDVFVSHRRTLLARVNHY